MTDSPEEYREKAGRLREEAERATFAAIRDMLRKIASQYDQLAEASERFSDRRRA